MVTNAALAGSIERTHRPGTWPVRMEWQEQGHSILISYLTAASVGPPRSSSVTAFSTSRPRSGWGGNPATAFRSSRQEINLVVLGLASSSPFSMTKRNNEEQGPAPSGGPNPGLQLTNPFRHAGWQAPIGAPAPAGQRLDRLARTRRQPTRRMRPARLPPGGLAPGFATEPSPVRPTPGPSSQKNGQPRRGSHDE